MRATSSLVTTVLNPLADNLQNWMTIVATDSDPCPLTPTLMKAVNSSRVRSVAHFNEDSQGKSFHHSLVHFEKSMGGIDEISSFQLVLVLRHDIRWTGTTIDTWPANFSRFNFPDFCPKAQREDPLYGNECVSDLFYMMPGRLYRTFREIIMTDGNGCFDSTDQCEGCHENGHYCYPVMKDAVETAGGELGFAFSADLPDVTSTDSTPRVMDQYLHLTPLGDLEATSVDSETPSLSRVEAKRRYRLNATDATSGPVSEPPLSTEVTEKSMYPSDEADTVTQADAESKSVTEAPGDAAAVEVAPEHDVHPEEDSAGPAVQSVTTEPAPDFAVADDDLLVDEFGEEYDEDVPGFSDSEEKHKRKHKKHHKDKSDADESDK